MQYTIRIFHGIKMFILLMTILMLNKLTRPHGITTPLSFALRGSKTEVFFRKNLFSVKYVVQRLSAN